MADANHNVLTLFSSSSASSSPPPPISSSSSCSPEFFNVYQQHVLPTSRYSAAFMYRSSPPPYPQQSRASCESADPHRPTPSHCRSASQPASLFSQLTFQGPTFSPTASGASIPAACSSTEVLQLKNNSFSSDFLTNSEQLEAPCTTGVSIPSLPPLSPSNNSYQTLFKQINADVAHNANPSSIKGSGHRRALSEGPFKLDSGLNSSLEEFSPDQEREKKGFSVDNEKCVLEGIQRAAASFSIYAGMDCFMEEGDVSDSEEDCAREESEKGMKISTREESTGSIYDVPKATFCQHHARSASMDSTSALGKPMDEILSHGPSASISPETRKLRHGHSRSFDCRVNLQLETANGELNEAELKTIMTNEKLHEIAVLDPRKAKRILANRQSAARSKERKMRYISELERKVQTLQTEAISLSAQLISLQRNSTGLSNENNELKIRLQAMEQQAQLHEALNDSLREEVQRLRVAAIHVVENWMPNQMQRGNMQPQFSSLFKEWFDRFNDSVFNND